MFIILSYVETRYNETPMKDLPAMPMEMLYIHKMPNKTIIHIATITKPPKVYVQSPADGSITLETTRISC
jgi:hypothetical protein